MEDEQLDLTQESHPLRTLISRTAFFMPLLKFLLLLLAVCLFVAAVSYWRLSVLNQPPAEFPTNHEITVAPGTEIRTITEMLEEENIVRSSSLLYYILVLFYDPTDVKASSYVFSSPITARGVAEQLTKGDFDTNLIRFTHFEGERASKLAERAATRLPNFSTERFLITAEPLEGKLFPDTYFIPQDYTDEELLMLLLDTFDEKMEPLQEDIAASPLSLSEVLILASILEREANDPVSMRTVSGILQNRLEIGMALQADASIEYVLDKPLSELTPEDLEIDSPYNTYLYPGLPPTPIGNPGLDSIQAVLHPLQSDYFYYITDADGIFYYSETYSEHLRNIQTYLR